MYSKDAGYAPSVPKAVVAELEALKQKLGFGEQWNQKPT